MTRFGGAIANMAIRRVGAAPTLEAWAQLLVVFACWTPTGWCRSIRSPRTPPGLLAAAPRGVHGQMKPIGYEGEADRLKRSRGSCGLVSPCPAHPRPPPPPGEVTTPRHGVQLKFHLVGGTFRIGPKSPGSGRMEADSWEAAARVVGGPPTTRAVIGQGPSPRA